MRMALQSFLSGGRRGVTHAPVVELDLGVCPTEPEDGGANQRSASWFRASTTSRSSTLSAKSLDGPFRDDNLLSSYRRGDLDLLEACLTVIDNRHGIEPVLNKLASGGKVKAADWASALLQLGIDEDFVARFDDKPGVHDRAEHTRGPDRVEHSASLRRSNTTLSSRCSFVLAKRSSTRSWGASAAREEAPAADLRRAFSLLSRLMARKRQREARGKLESPSDLGSEDFAGTLEVVQKARDCAQHLLRVANARGPSAAAVSPSGYAVLLLEHAAAAVQAGLYQKVHADLRGLLLLSELEPLLVVRSCIHGRPPAVQLLGWVIRCASQEILTQERDADICPDVFGSIELGLRLCFELTKLNKSLMRPPELHHASAAPSLTNMFGSLFSRRKVTDSDAVASSAATAAERLLNIVNPRTVFLALAPTAFMSDRTMVECLLRPGWGLLDEALIAEPSCTVRGGLAHVAKQMGISPPEAGMTVQRLSNSSRTGLDGPAPEPAPSVTEVANAIGELEEFMGKKASMARSAALYGGAFLMQRALDQFDRTRTRRRSSTADTRRTSVILGRRDSTGSVRHSTVSGASRPSLDGVQDGQRHSSRAETWAGLASAHRLSDAMRPHMPPFFEGRQGRVVPEPSEDLREAANAQRQREAAVLRGRGWLQQEWTDVGAPEAAREAGSPEAAEAAEDQDSGGESGGESDGTAS